MYAAATLICKEFNIETRQNRHKSHKETKYKTRIEKQIKTIGKELSQFTKIRRNR